MTDNTNTARIVPICCTEKQKSKLTPLPRERCIDTTFLSSLYIGRTERVKRMDVSRA